MHTVLRITAIVLLLIISIAALAAGYSFIVEPSGKGLGISPAYLKPTAPFKDYLIPGIVLFTVNGVISVFIAILTIIKAKHYSLFIIMQGCMYVGWIFIQLTMVKTFHPFHAIVVLIGIFLIGIGSLLYKDAHHSGTLALR